MSNLPSANESHPRRLLIIACSKRKQQIPEKLPAVERYNGPTFQVLHKFLASNPQQAKNLDVYILSAKFGLIHGQQAISLYDLQMNSQRANKLNGSILEQIGKILACQSYDEVFICAGKKYLLAMKGYDQLIPGDLKITIANGSNGRRQALLRAWLYDTYLPENEIVQIGHACIRGVRLTLTPEEIIKIGCHALSEKKGEPFRYQLWYVFIKGHRVAPKWLVSQLTGLPVNQFHSEEARRALQRLGIEVMRI